MKPIDFIKEHLQSAYQAHVNSGIDPCAILAQSAVETGWGEHVRFNNFFGIKGNKKNNDKTFRTLEYLDSPDLSYLFPKVYEIKQMPNGKYRYDCEDYFRHYENAHESFLDYTKFIEANKNYAEALKVKDNRDNYLTEIAKGGYATGANYAPTCISVANSIERIIEKNNLLIIKKP